MTATIGPNDLDLYASPRSDLLREITRLEPVGSGTHVLLEGRGIRSTQRVALGDVGGVSILAIWPAELKEQGLYLYGQRKARPMIRCALSRAWSAEAAPQLAFRSSQPALRLYMSPDIDPLEYARRWEEEDWEWVGAHPRPDVLRTLWPWLKGRGYVTDADDGIVEQWLDSCLGRRDAFLRPGLRLKRRCRPEDSPAELRDELNAILAAADEPELD